MVALVREYPNDDAAEPRDERRIFSRIPAEVPAEARRLDHSLHALRAPRLRLDVQDLSLSGLCAHSDQPVMRGEHLAIHLPPRDGLPTFSAYGRVTRCQPTGSGYKLAIEFDRLPAA
jgi:hypothetical protein